MPAQPVPAAGTDLAGLKAVIAEYDALRESAHANASAVIAAGSRLRAVIMAKQLISAEPSELLEAAYAEVTIIIGLLEELAETLADFDGEA